MVQERHRVRWLTSEGKALADEVVARLLAGREVSDLGIGEHDGRIDLRGLPMPQPQRLRRYQSEGWFVEELSDRLCFNGVQLVGLDLSEALLDSIRWWDATVQDCRFDGARCQHLGLLRTQVVDCSFAGADLHHAALGAWSGGGNVFRHVTFANADFRVGSCSAATFLNCDFAHARIEDVDFQSSSFVRCRFAGELRKVMFYDRGFSTGKPDANPMDTVDFSRAVLRDVEFRRLNLDTAILPDDGEHLIVHSYRCTVEHALSEVADQDSREARILTAILKHRLRWAGPQQQVGVFNLSDLHDRGGPALTELAAAALRRGEGACTDHPDT